MAQTAHVALSETSMIYPPRPCPSVDPDDYRSYLARARWSLDNFGESKQVEADIQTAAQMAPHAWEPWAMWAGLAVHDAARQLDCYDQAIARGGDAKLWMARADVHRWLGRLAEAEEGYSSLIELSPEDAFPRLWRAEVRAELGKYAAAIDDTLVADSGLATHRLHSLRAVLLWIEGDFAAAYKTFSFPTYAAGSPAYVTVWSQLCQIAHGAAPSVEDTFWEPSPPRSRRPRLARIAFGEPQRGQGSTQARPTSTESSSTCSKGASMPPRF